MVQSAAPETPSQTCTRMPSQCYMAHYKCAFVCSSPCRPWRNFVYTQSEAPERARASTRMRFLRVYQERIWSNIYSRNVLRAVCVYVLSCGGAVSLFRRSCAGIETHIQRQPVSPPPPPAVACRRDGERVCIALARQAETRTRERVRVQKKTRDVWCGSCVVSLSLCYAKDG